MEMVFHGGGCCGMRTIKNFENISQTAVDLFRRMVDGFREGTEDWSQNPRLPQNQYIPLLRRNGNYLTRQVLERDGFTDVEPIENEREVNHLYYLPRQPPFQPFQPTQVAVELRRYYANRLIEVVLTDNQLNRSENVDGRDQTWLSVLTDLGFRRVTRFRNSNSGNYCTVFHFVANPENTWERPTVVHTYYRKVYHSGNVGPTMFATWFEAANGRHASINKYEVMSDGSTVTTTGVSEDEEG